jgi:hypothetical protein
MPLWAVTGLALPFFFGYFLFKYCLQYSSPFETLGESSRLLRSYERLGQSPGASSIDNILKDTHVKQSSYNLFEV